MRRREREEGGNPLEPAGRGKERGGTKRERRKEEEKEKD